MEAAVILMISAVGAVAIVALLVVREIGVALYDFLHWPKWLVAHLDKQRAAEVERVLQALGVRESDRRAIRSVKVKERIRIDRAQIGETGESRAFRLLAKSAYVGEYPVGRRHTVNLPYYIDLFSESLNPESADEFAQILLAKLHDSAGDYQFQRVIGIKAGSPLLAAAVARRLSLPLVLHRGVDDAKPIGVGAHPRIDGDVRPGEILLLVDDSATGGRMVRECIGTIAELHATISHVLVFFEPLSKDSRGVIEGAGSKFTSVVQMTPEIVSRLST